MLSLETMSGYGTILVQSVQYDFINTQRFGSHGVVVMKDGGCFPGE